MDRNRDKFSEPRGWALKWVFAEETTVVAVKSSAGNGGREKFLEPHGWALKWDGSALAEAEERRNSTV